MHHRQHKKFKLQKETLHKRKKDGKAKCTIIIMIFIIESFLKVSLYKICKKYLHLPHGQMH